MESNSWSQSGQEFFDAMLYLLANLGLPAACDHSMKLSFSELNLFLVFCLGNRIFWNQRSIGNISSVPEAFSL